MKKSVILVIIMILLSTSVYSFSLNNFLTNVRSKLTITGAAVTEPPIFYCSFDETFECDNNQLPIVNLHPSFESGYFNQAVLLDNSDKLIYNSEGNIESSKGTIELWFKPLIDTDVATIIEDSKSGACGNFIFKLDSQNKISFNPKRGSRLNVISDTALELDKWYHITVTWDSKIETKVYINGQLEDTKLGIFTPEQYRPQLRVGQPCGTSIYNRAQGLIDELKIYNYVRTPEQILNENKRIPIIEEEISNNIPEEDLSLPIEIPIPSPSQNKTSVWETFLNWISALFS
jgi:hypothetical protein